MGLTWPAAFAALLRAALLRGRKRGGLRFDFQTHERRCNSASRGVRTSMQGAGARRMTARTRLPEAAAAAAAASNSI